MASTIATIGRSTQYPSTGFLRFGIPWLLVCALVVAYRGERPARTPTLAAYALVGVAADLELRDGLLHGRDVRRDRGGRGLDAPGRTAPALRRHPPRRWARPPRSSPSRPRRPPPRPDAGGRRTSAAISTSCASTRCRGSGSCPCRTGRSAYLMGGLYVASLVAVCVFAARGRRRARAPLDDRAAGRGEHVRRRLAHVLPGPLASQQPHARGAAVRRHADALDARSPGAPGCATASRSPRRRGAGRRLRRSADRPAAAELVDKAPDSALVAAVHSATGDGTGLAQRVRALTDLPVIRPAHAERRGARARERAGSGAAARRRRAGGRDRDADPPRPLGRPADRDARAGRPLGQATPDAAARRRGTSAAAPTS